MKTDPELDELLIKNIADLDASAKRIEALGSEIWGAVGTHLSNWANDKNWGVLEAVPYPWVAPPGWMQGNDDYLACFYVGWGPGDTGKRAEGEAYFDLSRFAGVGSPKVCLWLLFKAVPRKVWMPFLIEVRNRGNFGQFNLDETDGFHIDCTPRPGTLAAAVENNDYAAAFEPLTRALDTAHEHWLLFDALLKKVRA